MIKIKMCLAFIAEFLSCIKSLPLSCSWQCAKLKAVLCEHRLKIERARKEGERAYLCNMSIEDNPYDAKKYLYLRKSWNYGFMEEQAAWNWKIKD